MKSTLQGNVTKIVIVIVLLLAGLVLAWFMAANSLPGSALYSFKTNFIEKIDESVQLSSEAKMQAHARLLENRLAELKRLVERGEASEGALTALQSTVERHVNAFTEALGDPLTQSTTESELKAISDFVGIAATMEEISESNEQFATFGDYMGDVRRDAVRVYQDKIDRFVERETPERIFNLIRIHLTDVSRGLQNEQLSKKTVDIAETYISRVEPALTEGDYPRAFYAIADAMRFINIDLRGALAFMNNATPDITDDEEDDMTGETDDETSESAEIAL